MLKPPIEPMEAESVERIPEGSDWQYDQNGMAFVACSFVMVTRFFFNQRVSNPSLVTFPKSRVRLKL